MAMNNLLLCFIIQYNLYVGITIEFILAYLAYATYVFQLHFSAKINFSNHLFPFETWDEFSYYFKII